MLSYLAAFSCELAWLLESNGDLHVASYLLCVLFFVLFVAACILIHGMATNSTLEVASWAILVGVLCIPELIFVVHMISEHWGLYSAHGLTEFIGYLIRITINAIGLMCVVTQCIRWRRESKMLLSKILIDPNHPGSSLSSGHPHIHYQQHPQYAMASTGSAYGGGGTLSKKTFDNFAFNAIECPPLPSATFAGGASKNEFNASSFGLHVEAAGGGYNSSYPGHNHNRSHSLHDIRIAAGRPFAPVPYNPYTGFENPMLLQKNNHRYEHNMYHTIHFKPKVYNKQSLKRNCISMENLKAASSGAGGYNSNTNSLARSLKGKSSDKKASSSSNQCLNISGPMPLNNNSMSSQYFHMPFGYIYDRIEKKNSPGGGGKMSNSKQSLGTNASSDDCFRYRDVAL